MSTNVPMETEDGNDLRNHSSSSHHYKNPKEKVAATSAATKPPKEMSTNVPMETEDGNELQNHSSSSHRDPKEKDAATSAATKPPGETKEDGQATTSDGNNNESTNLIRELGELIDRRLVIGTTSASQNSPQPGGSRPDTMNANKIKKKWRRGNRAGRRVQERKKIRYEAELILAASDNQYGVRSDVWRGRGGRRQWRGRRGSGRGKFNN